MHDAKGRELKVGDTVLIPCRVDSLGQSEEYCNVSVTTIGGRLPDGQHDSFSAINTKQLLRANEGDDTSIVPVETDGKIFLT